MITFGSSYILSGLIKAKHRKFFTKFGHFKDGTGPKGRIWRPQDELVLSSFAGGLMIIFGLLTFIMDIL